MCYEQPRIARITLNSVAWTRPVLVMLFASLLFVSGCAKTADSPGPLDTPEAVPPAEPATGDAIGSDAERQLNPPISIDPSQNTTSDQPSGGIEMPANVDPNTEGTEEPAPPASGGIEMPADVPVDSESSLQSPVQLRFASWEEIEQAAKQTRRITVVDLWSLSCEPCLKEFPGLVRLHQQFGSSVACIGVDVDYDGRKTRPPETYRPRVEAYLASVNAGFTNYISSTASEAVFDAVDVGSIPAVLIFDDNGNLVKKFADVGATAGFTYEKDVIPFIERMAS